MHHVAAATCRKQEVGGEAGFSAATLSQLSTQTQPATPTGPSPFDVAQRQRA